MIHIKKDTILRAGDLLRSPDGKEKWEVKNVIGLNINVIQPMTKNEKVFHKNDLLIGLWTLEIGNKRGYW